MEGYNKSSVPKRSKILYNRIDNALVIKIKLGHYPGAGPPDTGKNHWKVAAFTRAHRLCRTTLVSGTKSLPVAYQQDSANKHPTRYIDAICLVGYNLYKGVLAWIHSF